MEGTGRIGEEPDKLVVVVLGKGDLHGLPVAMENLPDEDAKAVHVARSRVPGPRQAVSSSAKPCQPVSSSVKQQPAPSSAKPCQAVPSSAKQPRNDQTRTPKLCTSHAPCTGSHRSGSPGRGTAAGGRTRSASCSRARTRCPSSGRARGQSRRA